MQHLTQLILTVFSTSAWFKGDALDYLHVRYNGTRPCWNAKRQWGKLLALPLSVVTFSLQPRYREFGTVLTLSIHSIPHRGLETLYVVLLRPALLVSNCNRSAKGKIVGCALWWLNMAGNSSTALRQKIAPIALTLLMSSSSKGDAGLPQHLQIKSFWYRRLGKFERQTMLSPADTSFINCCLWYQL